MRTKILALVAVILISVLAYALFKDLGEMGRELNQSKSQTGVKKKPAPVAEVKPKPKIKPKPRPKPRPKSKPKSRPKKKTAEKKCCKTSYKVTYGRKPDVVSQPLWVPKDKTGYYQDSETGRWYWGGD